MKAWQAFIQPSGFVNKVLLESSQALSLKYCLCLAFTLQMAELSSDDRHCLTHKASKIYHLALYGKCAELYARLFLLFVYFFFLPVYVFSYQP